MALDSGNATRDGRFVISTDPARLDLDVIHGYLTRSYWSPGVSRETVAASLRGSICFGLFDGDEQIGFARVVTDGATFAYLADVFVLESHRGRGLATWFMEVVMAHPDLRGIRRWMLVTADAHGLYRKVGFTEPSKPERIMEKLLPDPYGASRG